MTKISQTKTLRRDICRTVGHEWKTYSRQLDGASEGGNRCTRCKKRERIWGQSKPVFVGTLPTRVDVPVGQVFYDTSSGYMIINDGTSWRSVSGS